MYKNGQEDLLEENTKVRLHSQELKLKAVSAHLHDGRTLHDVTASFGISDPSVLKRWCKEYRAAGIVSSSVRGRPRKHLDNPEEIIKELEM
ncbi:MAG: hypothetical protein LUG14_09805 [Synergistaceae bacterium]|nr:hypothetical protein [Synergistaceae bacterium]